MIDLPAWLTYAVKPNLVGFENEVEREKWFKALSTLINELVAADRQIRDDSADMQGFIVHPSSFTLCRMLNPCV